MVTAGARAKSHATNLQLRFRTASFSPRGQQLRTCMSARRAATKLNVWTQLFCAPPKMSLTRSSKNVFRRHFFSLGKIVLLDAASRERDFIYAALHVQSRGKCPLGSRQVMRRVCGYGAVTHHTQSLLGRVGQRKKRQQQIRER